MPGCVHCDADADYQLDPLDDGPPVPVCADDAREVLSE